MQTSGQIFLFYPQAHDRFVNSRHEIEILDFREHGAIEDSYEDIEEPEIEKKKTCLKDEYTEPQG